MLLVLFALILLNFLLPNPASAQTPLYYQLIESYQPESSFRQIIPTPTPTPLSTVKNTDNNDLPIVIAVLGDSMIDTLGDGIPQLQAALQKYFPGKKFNITNYGVGASTIDYALFRLTNDYEYLGKTYQSLISIRPDIIVVESFAYNNFGNNQSGFDKQWLTLGAITTTIKDKLPNTKIVLASTIAPNSITFSKGIAGINFTSLEKLEKTKTIKLYLQNLVNFATSQKFPLADAFRPGLINNEGLTDFINTTDYIHPSILGGEFFCDTVAKTIFDNHLLD